MAQLLAREHSHVLLISDLVRLNDIGPILLTGMHLFFFFYHLNWVLAVVLFLDSVDNF